MDGSEKLPQRIFAAVPHATDLRPFAFATAAWLRHVSGRTHDGPAYLLRPPCRGAHGGGGERADAAALYDAVSALVPIPAPLRAETVPLLDAMLTRPMAEVIRDEARPMGVQAISRTLTGDHRPREPDHVPVVREEDRLTALAHGRREPERRPDPVVVEGLVDVVGDERQRPMLGDELGVAGDAQREVELALRARRHCADRDRLAVPEADQPLVGADRLDVEAMTSCNR